MSASPFNWKVPAGRALEAALNRALALDPETRDALRPLDGHTVVLQLDAPPLALQVRVDGERVEVGPVDGARESDLSVRSTLGGLIAQLPWFKREDARPVG
jgi:ubiquinone biosynthesis protein UbiJ